jgi:hypothetical protein
MSPEPAWPNTSHPTIDPVSAHRHRNHLGEDDRRARRDVRAISICDSITRAYFAVALRRLGEAGRLACERF